MYKRQNLRRRRDGIPEKIPAAGSNCRFCNGFIALDVYKRQDLYLPDFYQDKTVREAYERYLQAMLKTLQNFQHYDVVGHIGYCCKYCGNYQKLPFCYDLFPDLFDAILKTVIQNGKGIELNTSAAKITGGIGTPTPSILRRYLELGGEIITTGSDGHRPGEVGRFLTEGTQALKDMGFRYICTFEKRKPIFHKL